MNAKQRLADIRQAGAATQMRRAAEMVTEQVMRDRMDQLAESLAKVMASEYQKVLEGIVSGIMHEVASAVGQLEKQLSRPAETPQVDMAGVERVVASLKESIDSIEFPAPEAPPCPPLSEMPSGAREFHFQIERDSDGLLSGLVARSVEE